MFTVCPGCTRQFQVYAGHLAVASGRVRCGFCHEQFNALERLYDKPLSNETIPNKKRAFDEGTEDESGLALPDMANPDSTSLEQDVLISNSHADTSQELKTAMSEIGIRPPVEEIKSRVKKERAKQKNAETETPAVLEEHYYFSEKEALLQEQPVKNKAGWGYWLLSLFWTSATLFALLAIILQLVWFNRDQLLLKYPEYLPYARQICAELGCELIRQRDVSAIKLISRDVRLHPDYQDALLVNAAMKNELPVRQPYPRVQLTLFDTSGALLAYREFMPTDYLDSSIKIDKGMPIDSPVYFVLEVSAPTSGAVSFEFRFL